MSKLEATEFDASVLRGLVASDRRLKHLRVRRHGGLLILESGSPRELIPHARFRRVTRQWWRLEMPTHTRGWEPTPYRDGLRALLGLLVEQFPWTILPLGRERTSGTSH